MKIGVFGGTFNPIHTAHISMATQCVERLGLDKILLVPTYLPPHKTTKDLASAHDRLAMCRLAVGGLPSFAVSDFEVEQGGKSFTFKTLGHLHSQYPGAQFYLIMGADMFLTVQNWRCPGEIFRLATLCAAQREPGEGPQLDTHKAYLEAQGAACVVLDVAPTPLSSTLIRQELAEGADVSSLVHTAVLAYIHDRHLYGQ